MKTAIYCRRMVQFVVSIVLALIVTIQWGMTPANAAETDYGNRYVKMDTAYLHGMALRANGTIADWGFYLDGTKPVPSGLTGVVDIAEGWSFSVALKSDGTVVAWGKYHNNGNP